MVNRDEIDTTQHPDRNPFGALAARLTSRQLDVLALMCEGFPNKVISRQLNIANGTVKIHVANILRALNVSSRLQAVIVARGLGSDSGFGRHEEPFGMAKPVRPVGLRLVKNDEMSARECAFDSILQAAAG